jgi:hypothetical protein
MAINVDIDDLVLALQKSQIGDGRTFLNLDTGGLAFYYDGMLTDVDVECEGDEADEALEAGNYFEIDPLPSHEAFAVMEQFVNSLSEGIERIRLTDAINGGKPFRRFKDILTDYPDLRKQWFSFEENAYREFAKRLLADNGIEAILVYPARG